MALVSVQAYAPVHALPNQADSSCPACHFLGPGWHPIGLGWGWGAHTLLLLSPGSALAMIPSPTCQSGLQQASFQGLPLRQCNQRAWLGLGLGCLPAAIPLVATRRSGCQPVIVKSPLLGASRGVSKRLLKILLLHISAQNDWSLRRLPGFVSESRAVQLSENLTGTPTSAGLQIC